MKKQLRYKIIKNKLNKLSTAVFSVRCGKEGWILEKPNATMQKM